MDAWLMKNKNEAEWFDNAVPNQRKRELLLQWLSAAWKEFASAPYVRARHGYWVHTGCGRALDVSEDHLIQIEGHRDYNLPKP